MAQADGSSGAELALRRSERSRKFWAARQRRGAAGRMQTLKRVPFLNCRPQAPAQQGYISILSGCDANLLACVSFVGRCIDHALADMP